mmetsp:Transcript_33442/g.36981  ORF Transcript_33442/g.36981 Transcript_33442/m.36981 type:complete len:510 (+) Transcript_33442:149-1678(+)
MTTIPADPSLVLGTLVDVERIKHLQEIAEAQKPEIIANEKLQRLLLTRYRLEAMTTELREMKKNGRKTDIISRIETELRNLNHQVTSAALEVAIKTMECYERVEELEDEFGQRIIYSTAESPLEFSLSPVKTYPFSSDTMKFDVQYFRIEDNNEMASSNHANRVSSYLRTTIDNNTSNTDGIGLAATNMIQNQMTNHNIDGTIVISAFCNHRQADIISPLILDARKLLAAWNQTFPDDYLDPDPKSMFDAGLKEEDERNDIKSNKLHLLTGCTRASSFVGFAHVLKVERTESDAQIVNTNMNLLTEKANEELYKNSLIGHSGFSNGFSTQIQDIMSSSKVSVHCNVITQGVISDISSNIMNTMIKEFQPNPKDIMRNLSAIEAQNSSAISDGTSSNNQVSVEKVRNVQRFNQLNSSYLKEMGNVLSDLETKNNQIVDLNSLMTAFTNYIQRVTSENNSCGIPVNFFVKYITKGDVAREYIRKYFPYGYDLKKRGAIEGQLGISSISTAS